MHRRQTVKMVPFGNAQQVHYDWFNWLRTERLDVTSSSSYVVTRTAQMVQTCSKERNLETESHGYIIGANMHLRTQDQNKSLHGASGRPVVESKT